ncbi:MAG: hypothetical protein DMG38_07465 [Acidobacteria bacterium]|nr:MAG: hypothetical protein DMG38_07465 [Acidobacteriota bacterium]
MTWQEREEQAAADLGMTQKQYRVLRMRTWPWWIVGSGRQVRTRLFKRQHGLCPLPYHQNSRLNGPCGDKDHVDHIRPRKEFVVEDLPILEAIKACWDDKNLQLVHQDCHKRKTKEQRNKLSIAQPR